MTFPRLVDQCVCDIGVVVVPIYRELAWCPAVEEGVGLVGVVGRAVVLDHDFGFQQRVK